MADLVAGQARWAVSDWGLARALTPPQSATPAGYDRDVPRRALLTEVLAAATTGRRGPLDLVYKQANLRADEHAALVELLGPPERTIFCLRDPAGFARSAVRKFPDVPVEHLLHENYIGTIEEHARLGGEVFLYHPDVTGEDYAAFLRPLGLTEAQRSTVRYSGSEAPELTTPAMWEAFHRLAGHAVNRSSTPA